MKHISMAILLVISTCLFAENAETPILTMNLNEGNAILLNDIQLFQKSSSEQRHMLRYHYLVDIGNSLNMFIYLRPRNEIPERSLLKVADLNSTLSASTSFGLGSIFDQLLKYSSQKLEVNGIAIKKYYSEWGSFISTNILVYWCEIDDLFFSDCLVQFIDPISNDLMATDGYKDSDIFKEVIEGFDNLIKTIRFANNIYRYKTTDNLRLRTTPSLNSDTITILPQSTLVVVEEFGESEVIDKISGTWVRITAAGGFTGWCFDGYLEYISTE